MKATSPNTKICALCVHWNGPLGGKNVKPRVGMRNVFEYEPSERSVCFITILTKQHGIHVMIGRKITRQLSLN